MAEKVFDMSEGQDVPLSFTAAELQEITGAEKLESIDDFKDFYAGVSNKEPEKVTTDYEFKDDFIKGAVEYYGRTGEIAAYARNNVDYDKLESKDLVRLEIKKANEGLSDRAIDHLTTQEMKKFELGEDASEDDKLLQKELLDVRTGRFKGILNEDQKKFNTPETVNVDLEKWADNVNDDTSTKGLLSNSKIEYKHGDTPFNLDVTNPKDLVDMTIDNTSFFKMFVNKDGTTDFDKWYKVMAYAQNPESVEGLLIKHGQSIGTESVVDEIKNSELERKSKSGGSAGGLLEAFANKKLG
jgi:hypothetical protein